ncbi:RHS repeat-associated core domain-containing protein [Pyxidicoccus sp. 3LG]
MHPRRSAWWLTCAWLLASSALAQTSTSLDAKVQAPELGAPQRGSLAGQLASVAFGPADVSRGAFSLPAPFSFPTERGVPLGRFFPVYSPDSGLSEWGVGWQSALAFTRWRARGDLDYATDGLSGPWGQFVPGDDGYWYPNGLGSPIRLEHQGNTLVAYHPDGSRWTFGGANRVQTPRGTYAWLLGEVETALGRKTRFEYEANTSGRLFLKTVSYGGLGDDFQHRVTLEYETLTQPFRDFRSGAELTLDRRVKTAVAQARHAVTGVFEERWRHELTWQAEGVGPAFYLQAVLQRFRSGQTAPPSVYTYRLATEHFATASLEYVPKLDGLLTDYAVDVIQPNRGTLLDINQDGRVDLERAFDNTLLVHGDDGFTSEPLPPRPPDAVNVCRNPQSSFNLPRALAQLRADDSHQVVSLQPSALRTQTTLTVCNRPGQPLATQVLSGDWGLASNVRLVDINRDHRPDLVRVASGEYRILPNTSSATTFSFGALAQGILRPTITPNTSWLHDFNGDSLPDIVSRYSGGVMVWFGLGNLAFQQTGQSFEVKTLLGTTLTDLSDFQVNFADTNRDGLTDLLLTRVSSPAAHLLVNTGSRFQEVSVTGLTEVGALSSRPVVADLSGSGNTEVTYTRTQNQVPRAYRLALDTPGTALMHTADDGKGTVLTFEYQRAPPVPGHHQRNAVLSRLKVRSSGYDTVAYDYTYESPAEHEVGRFLLGFGRVTRQDPVLTHTVDFLHEDRFAGVLLGARKRDVLAPELESFESRTYDDAVFHGVPWKRPATQRSGWKSTTDPLEPAVEELTEYLEYSREVCPARTRLTGAHGTLLTETEFLQPQPLALHQGCLERRVVRTGLHPQSALDFYEETLITRNAVGLAVKVESIAPEGAMVVQEAVYGPGYSVESLSSPGHGASTFFYDPVTRLLRRTEMPDGVVQEVVERDPLTDSVRALRATRGTLVHQQFFRHDGLERLERSWDDLGTASQTQPLQRLSYQYATATHPGHIAVVGLVDGTAGIFHESREFATAAGEALTSASLTPNGWAFSDMVRYSRTLGEQESLLRPPVSSSVDPATLDLATLFQGTEPIARTTTSAHGHMTRTWARPHTGVESQSTALLEVRGGWLVETDTENGASVKTTTLDAARRTVVFADESQARYEYRYDSQGRLREVQLPDGHSHRTTFDAHGRVSRVERTDSAIIDYSYEPATGALTRKDFRTPAGVLARTVSWTHDGLGRVREELHTDVASGTTLSFRYYYDGATPAAPQAHDTPGLLTAVEGDGYVKELRYRADGQLRLKRLTFPGWRTVETEVVRLDSGEVGEQTVRVLDAQGALLSSSTQEFLRDAWGRPSGLGLDGASFATFGYDANNQLQSASFASGEQVVLTLDALTRRRMGETLTAGTWSASFHQQLGPRGLVDSETSTVGGQTRAREYTYSPPGFLSGATDAQDVYGYGFDTSGLPTHITHNGQVRTFSHGNGTLTIGGTLHRFDGLGRTVERGDLLLTYGPNGQVARARRGGAEWTFLYDEQGHRLLKLHGGFPVAAYLDEGYLDTSGLVERVLFGGKPVGILRDGTFEMLATDPRGTIFAERDGPLLLASPFGERSVRPAASAALDYAQKGYDADLGLVRMGVRDYDPGANRFLTADPLFLESPAKCLESPVECNLYGYARGNPTTFIDPQGTCAVRADLTLDCVGPNIARGSEMYSVAQQNWKEGNYGTAAMGAVLGFLNEGTVVVSYGGQFIVEAYNGPYLATTGFFIEGDFDKALDGSVRTLAAFLPMKLGMMANAPAAAGRVATAEAPALLGASKGGGGPTSNIARHVNPGYPTFPGTLDNCINCVIAMDATLGGAPASAMRSMVAQSKTILEQYFGKQFTWMTKGDIRTLLKTLGEGARGVVALADATKTGHVVNVINRGGKVTFIDPQSAKEISVSTINSYKEFFIIITHVP